MYLNSFAEDRKTVDAVVRNFTIIGEATNRIPEQVINENQEIPWREMSDMRNIVVHEYFGVSDKILWETMVSQISEHTCQLQHLGVHRN
ncbi:MAG: HepT-like ribonuclease domain-containing protein [Desulfobacterales bacterium]